MTANLFIPCLTVTQIIKSFHIEEYDIWLPILVGCIACVASGYLIGVLLNLLCNYKSEIKRLILINLMFSNSTSMQLIYTEALASILTQLTGESVESKLIII
jgi:predicted permease